MAIAISPLALWTDIGGSIGSAISAAVWSNKLPKNLNKYLGLNATQIEDLYDSIVVARLAEPRDLVIEAYNDTVYDLFLPALVLSFLPLAAGFYTTSFFLGYTHNPIKSKRIAIQGADKTSEEAIRRLARKAEISATSK